VRAVPRRLHDAKGLATLPGVGPAVVAVREKGRERWEGLFAVTTLPPTLFLLPSQLVSDALWAAHPPPRPSAADLVADAEAAVAAKAAKAAARAPPPSLSAPAPAPSSRPYTPAVGTAAYAFLVALHHATVVEGAPSVGKAALVAAAEASGLADRPIAPPAPVGPPAYGQGRRPQYSHAGGWASFRALAARDPPLAAVWSSPLAAALTPAGVALAARLRADAACRGTLPAAWRREGDSLPAAAARPAALLASPPPTLRRSPRLASPVILLTTDDDGTPGERACKRGRRSSGGGGSRLRLSSDGGGRPPRRRRKSSTGVVIVSDDEEEGGDEARRRSSGARASPPAPLAARLGLVPLTRSSQPQRQHPAPAPAPPPSAARSLNPWRLPTACAGAAPATLRLPPLPPGVAFGAVYDVVLCLDDREHFGGSISGPSADRGARTDAALAALAAAGTRVEKRRLPGGDAVWLARRKRDKGGGGGGAAPAPAIASAAGDDDYVLDFVVERKRVDDLIGSLRSGRLARQTHALARGRATTVALLVEGDARALASDPGRAHKAVVTACHSAEVHDGLVVFRTESAAATFRLYAGVTRRLTAAHALLMAGDGAPSSAGCPPTLARFSADVAAARAGRTVSSSWALMLAAADGVGPDAAAALAAAHPTPKELWRELRESAAGAESAAAAAAAAAADLADLRLPSGARRVGPAAAAALVDALTDGGRALLL